MQQSSTNYQSQLDNAVNWIMNGNLPRQEKLLIVLLLRNGLRVSEICNPSNIKFTDKWNALIYCEKNKVWRTITTAEANEIASDSVLTANLQYWKRNRQYYYRQLKGLLVDVESRRITNNPVTHAARNIKAQQSFDATESAMATATSIGNKSKKATERYIPRRRSRAFLESGIKGNVSGTVAGENSTRTGVLRQSKS